MQNFDLEFPCFSQLPKFVAIGCCGLLLCVPESAMAQPPDDFSATALLGLQLALQPMTLSATFDAGYSKSITQDYGKYVDWRVEEGIFFEGKYRIYPLLPDIPQSFDASLSVGMKATGVYALPPSSDVLPVPLTVNGKAEMVYVIDLKDPKPYLKLSLGVDVSPVLKNGILDIEIPVLDYELKYGYSDGFGNPIKIKSMQLQLLGNCTSLGTSQDCDFDSGTWITTYSFVKPPATVPVPSAFWLFGSALAGLAVTGRRKASDA